MGQKRLFSAGQERTKQDYLEHAAILKALAHPTRLFIVAELAYGERCVHDLRDLVGHDISTVSKHLATLKTCGVVVADKRGKQVYYRLKVPCVINVFHCVESVVAANQRLG